MGQHQRDPVFGLVHSPPISGPILVVGLVDVHWGYLGLDPMAKLSQIHSLTPFSVSLALVQPVRGTPCAAKCRPPALGAHRCHRSPCGAPQVAGSFGTRGDGLLQASFHFCPFSGNSPLTCKKSKEMILRSPSKVKPRWQKKPTAQVQSKEAEIGDGVACLACSAPGKGS